MIHRLTFAALTALLLFTGCSDSGQNRQQPDEAANALIAKTVYTLDGIDGSRFEITKEGGDFLIKGTPEPVVVYDIFATWCPPCRAEAPHLSSLQKKFAGKIKIIGVSIEEGMDNAYYQRFAKDHDITYTLVNSPDNSRFARAVASAIGVGRDFPIPLMVVYKNGRYVRHYSGLMPEEMLESDFRQLVQ